MATDYSVFLTEYQQQIKEVKNALDNYPENKHSLINNVYFHNKVLRQHYEPMIENIKWKKGESDFALISLIRCLYLIHQLDTELGYLTVAKPSSTSETTDQGPLDSEPTLPNDSPPPATPIAAEINSFRTEILAATKDFPFWPSTKYSHGELNDIVFWSENHLFMTLSSAYLYYQYLDLFLNIKLTPDESNQKDVISSMLLTYLQAHNNNDFSGYYEVNSQVYIPFSIAALLNLLDFSLDEEIAKLSEGVIDCMVKSVMACTDPVLGVANLSGMCWCSSRCFHASN
jgi:hypothetical protein